MIHLVKLCDNKDYPYWVINDTHGATGCGTSIKDAVARYKERKFKLCDGQNHYTIRDNCVYIKSLIYDTTDLDGIIILSCKRLSDISPIKYPELFI